MISKNEITSGSLGEKCVVAEHSSGLKIMVCEKPDFSSVYAIFGTKYGSIDTSFSRNGGNRISVPEGIAHFLEHKLFESEDGDAFEKFAVTGASANAYTSFDRTCYLFSCCNKVYENLEILLNFVRSPYFTEQTVKKEQGIIGQEITMYDDIPGAVVFYNMLKAMYKKHAVKINIAGTIKSISEIDHNLLYECYNTFYNPSNMFLCLAGNVSADKVCEIVEKTITDTEKVTIERDDFNEPEEISESFCEQKMSVGVPLFCFGIKDKFETADRTVKDIVATEILLDIIMGESTQLYSKLINQGLINKDFASDYLYGHGYSSIIFEGESSNMTKVANEIKDRISDLLKNGIDQEMFELVRRSHYGDAIREWNNPENIVSLMVDSVISDTTPFERVNQLSKITISDIQKRLSLIDIKNSVLSAINPI